MSAVPWRVAWQHALYDAELGFYVTRGGPAAHFTTAAHGPTGAVLAEALLRLWDRHVPGGPPSVVVDVGAGRGELATHLARVLPTHYPDPITPTHSSDPTTRADSPDRTTTTERAVRGRTGCSTDPFDHERSVRGEGGGRGDGDGREGEGTAVVGVDVVARPGGLDPGIDWIRSPGGPGLPADLPPLTGALVVAHEWLDVVPCTIAEVATDGVLREVLVDPVTGVERLGPPLTGPDREWADAHWPTRSVGDRVEVGRARDEAWAGLVARVRSGLVVAVDYGHLGSERPGGGTLAAYRQGHLTHPVPDGTCDLTAHVAMDTLDADELHRQRDLLVGLGLDASRPDHATARTDPIGYLRALERVSAQARLIERGGFGDFWWALKRVGRPHVT